MLSAGVLHAKGEVCGRDVHACCLDTGLIPEQAQPAACRRLVTVLDMAIMVCSESLGLSSIPSLIRSLIES